VEECPHHGLRLHLPRQRRTRRRRQHQSPARFANAGLHHLRQNLDPARDRSAANHPEDNLRIIEESVAYLKANGKRVIYDAEHFFDGYKADSSYALETLKAAIRGGAETVVLCDTNGGTMPWEVERIIRGVKEAIDHPFGIHTHNDSECAVVNALVAVREGAIQVQGTINGVGERCGNANLCSVMANLELKMGYQCLPKGNIQHLYDLSHFVAEVANLTPDEHLPFVGKSAFAHKGGVHVAAMRRSPQSYQHVEPELVGNKMRVVVSDLSGAATCSAKPKNTAWKWTAGSRTRAQRDQGTGSRAAFPSKPPKPRWR
jgi:2-isopropylmalate synthase